ncbi:MAG TPA: hypothetical protein VMW72_23770 [Sedimentisphaerales bacterium]|nr:hypothetical protein [Sedimentisphaerales bacterium]
MSEDKKRDRKTDEAKRRFGRFWSASIILAAVAIIFCLLWKISLWNFRSADEQLAAINAARAIPESENAGVAYCKLAEYNLPLPADPPVVDRQILSLTRQKPWHSNDYPRLAAWLDEWQDLISKLLDISRMEKCRLAILSERQQEHYFTNPVRQMRGWASLLVRSANMDAGEGRIDAAIEKYACVLQMGSHLRQQPVLSYYNNGVAKESLALDALKQFITQTELTEKQLTAIEAALLPAENQWKQHLKIMVKVQRLFERKGRPRLTDWRRYWEYRKVTSKSDEHLINATHRYHLSTLKNRRRMYILISLRRFKNKTGNWPRSLDRIKPSLSKETLTDPDNNMPFVYELKGEDFSLGSSEKNIE